MLIMQPNLLPWYNTLDEIMDGRPLPAMNGCTAFKRVMGNIAAVREQGATYYPS